MNINPIKTKADYQLALKRLEEIFDAPSESMDNDEAEILGLMVDDYEKKHYPIDAPDPIEAIKIRMEEMYFKQADSVDEREDFDMTYLENEEAEFMNHQPVRFGILEDAVDFQTQLDYVQYSHSFDRGELTEEQTIGLGDLVYSKQVPAEGKKKGFDLVGTFGNHYRFKAN